VRSGFFGSKYCAAFNAACRRCFPGTAASSTMPNRNSRLACRFVSEEPDRGPAGLVLLFGDEVALRELTEGVPRAIAIRRSAGRFLSLASASIKCSAGVVGHSDAIANIALTRQFLDLRGPYSVESRMADRQHLSDQPWTRSWRTWAARWTATKQLKVARSSGLSRTSPSGATWQL
jgi:hypothetical protein